MLNDKDKIQAAALEAWSEAGGRGIVVLPTGTGKTRLGRLISEKVGGRTLVLTSKITLIAQWKTELGESFIGDVACINSYEKYTDHYDLLIVDECHRSFSPVFRNLYSKIEYDKLLLLTATTVENEEYAKIAEIIAPVVYHVTLSDLSGKYDIVSDYTIYNVAIDFDKKSKAKYGVADGMMKEAAIKLMGYKKKIPSLRYYTSAFDIAKQWVKTPIVDYSDSKLIENLEGLTKASRAYWYAMSLRKSAVYENEIKIREVKKLLKLYPDRKWILFTKTKDFAERLNKEIGGEIYHSGMSKKEREEVLCRFERSDKGVLTSVKALVEGLDIVTIDAAIAVSYDSKQLEQIQALGRIIRKYEDKKALFFNLYTKETQEKKWVENKTFNLPVKWI